MINFHQNHFELFGLQPRFRLDLAELEQAYREIQSRIHPDKFVHAGDAAQFVVGPSQWEPQVKYSADGAKAVNVSYYGPTPQDFTSRYTAKFSAAPSYHSAGGYAAGLELGTGKMPALPGAKHGNC